MDNESGDDVVSMSYVGELSPAFVRTPLFPVKSVRSTHRRDAVACRCRCPRADGRGTGGHNEFDVASVATSCISHVDRLTVGRLPGDRRALLTAGLQHSHCNETGQSAAAFGNCLWSFKIVKGKGKGVYLI